MDNGTAKDGGALTRPAADKVAVRVLSITTALAAILIALALLAAVDFYEKKAVAKRDAFLQQNACLPVAQAMGKPAYRCSKLGPEVLTEDAIRGLLQRSQVPPK